jgi:hypothetical protein
MRKNKKFRDRFCCGIFFVGMAGFEPTTLAPKAPRDPGLGFKIVKKARRPSFFNFEF